ncbi:MAG: amino acid transport protein [Candidatus Sericytochromatia bacterium]
MDPTSLFMGFMLGTIGGGYFLYGKKQSNAVAMLCGAFLCVLPYFIPNLILLGIVSVLLMAAPIAASRYL